MTPPHSETDAKRPELAALHIADPPERWRALGFHVDERDVAHIGGIDVHLGASGRGITAWEITNLAVTDPSLDGLATTNAAATRAEAASTANPPPAEHPNQAIAIDHVVITTPDFDRTARALEDAGLPLSRIARVRSETIRQGFRRLGPAILELVENPSGPPGPATFWGLVIVVPDLARPHAGLREHLSQPRPAVQPARHIATLDRAAGLTPRVAFMDPDRDGQPRR
jgi:hypothetical protein